MMNLIAFLHFTNLFFAGILAGLEIAIHYGTVIPSQYLDEQSEIRLRQAFVLRLRVLVPAFFIPVVLSAAAVAIVDGTGSGFAFRCAAIVSMLLWIAVRVIATVQINSATLEWNAASPPANWRSLIERVERFHSVGVWAAVAAFAALLASVELRTAH